MGAISKEISTAWRALPVSEKAVYQQTYESDRTEYRESKREYEESNGPSLWLDKIIKLSDSKPPHSGYQLFLKTTLQETKRGDFIKFKYFIVIH